MRIERDIKLDYSDVLFKPKRSTLGSRSSVQLERTYEFCNYTPEDLSMEQIRPEKGNYTGIPIMAANMDGVGTFEVADTLAQMGMFTCLSKHYSVTELVGFFDTDDYLRTNHVAMSIGITQPDHQKFRDVYEQADGNLKYVCIDVANGYSESFVQFVADFRHNYPNIVIIAGNVVTADMTEELILRGADIVKVGIGPGSVCTTRIKTGVGYPQLSAVIECADAAHGLGGHIIADGGCSCPGDVAKAFGAGADFVMLGGMLAGTDQGGGDINERAYLSNELDSKTGELIIDNKYFVKFYGMSSNAAQEKHGGRKDYRASEGRVVSIPYRGDVQSILGDLLGSIRSTCTYVGAKSLKELSKRTTFVQVNGGKQHNTVYESRTIGE